jgi:hypothetical protein
MRRFIDTESDTCSKNQKNVGRPHYHRYLHSNINKPIVRFVALIEVLKKKIKIRQQKAELNLA